MNFCVIDIGTNAAKCMIFKDGKYIKSANKPLTNSGKDDLNKDEVISHILEYVDYAKEQNIDNKNIYICATEGFRTSCNRKEISEEIFEKTSRRIHILSPEREAYYSAIGGLRSIPPEKLKAKNVLYIESGGGSTEISLIDISGRPQVIATTSLPFGSKRYNEKGERDVYRDHIQDFIKMINDKNFAIDKSFSCIINSSTASRIIARRYNAQSYNPYDVMTKRQHISVKNFCYKLRELLKDPTNLTPEILEQYWVKDADGFIGHAHILNKIFRELEKQKFPVQLDNVSVATTIGGLKEGVTEELKVLKSKLAEPDKNSLRVYETEQPKPSQEEKIKKLKEKISEDKSWIEEYKNFYLNKNPDYHCDSTENYLTVKDKHENKIVYHAKDEVVITPNKASNDNKIYEDMIENAKKAGQGFVNFQDNVSLDLKLKIYAACLKHNFEVRGFTFEKDMLSKVSESTAEIVNKALQCEQNKQSPKNNVNVDNNNYSR